jgi:tellurite resistance protein TehA-like permease
MPIVFVIWGIICALFGILMLPSAKRAIHELEAGVAFVLATLSFGFAAVITAIKEAGNQQESG